MLLSIAGAALGDGIHAIAVSATVRQVCRIIAVPTLAFRPSNPATGAAVTAAWNAGSLRCTKGSTFTVVAEDPAREFETAGTNSRVRLADVSGAGCANVYECVRPTLTQVTIGTGLGLGAASNISFGLSGPAAFADYANEVGGMMILTVNP
jgi:spore coat protein U-like protein